MLAADLQNRIMNYIRAHSGFETKRTYVGMSHLSECPADQFTTFRDGLPETDYNHRMAYLGYALETVEKAILVNAGVLRSVGREIVAEFDNRIRGHIDGETVDGDLVEIKTVSTVRFERILESGKALRDHFTQVQAYMHFGGYRHAEIIYVCRDDFRHHVVHVAYQPGLGEQIEAKARRVLAAIDEGRQPPCECRRSDASK